MKVVINPKYIFIRDFVCSLPTYFDQLTEYELLHDGRNRIVKYDVAGYKLVIKSYGKPSLVNRFVYGRFRKSKAMRAYRNAQILSSLGVGTPEAIAVVEARKNGLLERSYFISLCSEFTPLPSIAPYCYKDFCIMLDQLARFIIHIHDLGIIHNDLNPSNILYSKGQDNHYEFELIDNNRMRFKKKLTMQDRLNDLRHFSSDDMPYLCMLHRYVSLIGKTDSEMVELKGVIARSKLLMLQKIKERAKCIIKY